MPTERGLRTYELACVCQCVLFESFFVEKPRMLSLDLMLFVQCRQLVANAYTFSFLRLQVAVVSRQQLRLYK